MKFKNYLMNEAKNYFGERIGDILSALHNLKEDAPNMGARHLIKASEQIVNQIRSILHSNWGKEEEKYLKKLQKAAVAIMKAIEEKDDLITILGSATAEIEQVVADLKIPISNLATPKDMT